MSVPPPTQQLLARLRRAAVLLDGVAAVAKTDRTYAAVHDAANTIWLAITRIEDLTMVLDDLELIPDADETERQAKDLNER